MVYKIELLTGALTALRWKEASSSRARVARMVLNLSGSMLLPLLMVRPMPGSRSL